MDKALAEKFAKIDPELRQYLTNLLRSMEKQIHEILLEIDKDQMQDASEVVDSVLYHSEWPKNSRTA
jgi:ABC-type thiamine transport system ATPase subunit